MANAAVQIQIVPSRRGGRNLFHNGYRFRVNRNTDDWCSWTCCSKGCKARVTTRNDILSNINDSPHNHDRQPFEAEVFATMSRIRKRVREESKPVTSIYEEELLQTHIDPHLRQSTAFLGSFATVKSSLYRERRKLLPPLPTSREDLRLPEEYSKTATGDNFLIADDGLERKILVFGTNENLTKLCASQKLLCDGTFYVTPSIFDQMYTIHALVGGQTYPLIYSLLPDRKQATYERLLTLIKNAAEQQGNIFQPHTIQADFERAFHNAVSVVFPLCQIKGCYFHYTQAIWRNTQRHGLATLYRDDPEVNRLVRRAAILPLTPMAEMENVWMEAINNCPQTPKCIAFADYVTENWIEGSWRRTTWNHFDTEKLRTNNNVEGWHHRINVLAKKGHPNIFEFLTMIRNEQAMTEIKIAQQENGAAPPQKKRKYRIIAERLEVLKDRYSAGVVSLMEFADSASYLVNVG